jgi:hypothetical protein
LSVSFACCYYCFTTVVELTASFCYVDGSYARIQARELVGSCGGAGGTTEGVYCANLVVKGGKLDFVELRAELEELTSTEFEGAWV